MKIRLIHLYRFALFASLIGVGLSIFDTGFKQSFSSRILINIFYSLVLVAVIASTVGRYFEQNTIRKKKVRIFDFLSVCLMVFMLVMQYQSPPTTTSFPLLYHHNWIKIIVLFTFFREYSELKIDYKRTILNPAQLFILSFMAIILGGAFLLMLPRATHEGISFINALFTSTSAVCVTGLIVVDTGSYFTTFGQTVIILLIQVGGIGILTFASYFSYFFKGGTSYENQLALSDMTSSKKLGEVFSTLKYILIITFGIELLAAFLIFTTLPSSEFQTISKQLYFSIFHSVSAFCNAGFSTLPNNLYESTYRFNYPLQVILIFAFVLGGLGFPILVNIINYLNYAFLRFFYFTKKKRVHKPWVLNLNSRITLVTTLLLSLIGFLFFFLLEYNNTLAEHSLFGKIITAFFGATTPRTAGFNSINMTSLDFSTLLLIFLLMWIGASPASTGGGIKTSTFAIATLNIISLAKGKTKIEVYKREIADSSIRRAFAIITLSLIAIGFSILLITIFDKQKELMGIAFECFSAYSTVGLSLGITGDLTTPSKCVIIVLMFVGRVSMLSLMIAVFKKVKHKNYQYPSEEITIN